MKAVLFAGGFGTRLSEATNLIPKPMVEIGGKPILWHIMKTYSHYGINEFVICCGYKQYVIKEYFANYFRHNCDMTVDLSNNTVNIHDNHSENWKVTMVDTGLQYPDRRPPETHTEIYRQRAFSADLRRRRFRYQYSGKHQST